jgi:hypothetical protein
MTAIQTIEEATQIAIDFVRKHYSFVYLMAAKKENSRWIVDLIFRISDLVSSE